MGKEKIKNHLYEVGSIVNRLIITEQCHKQDKSGIKHKAYKYYCPVCGYDCGEYYKNGIYHIEHMITEKNLIHGAGCVVCSKNGFVVPSINSIHALNPEIEMF